MPVTRLLQLTDCHLLADPQARLLDTDTAATLEAVVAHAVDGSTYDAILATGDIGHDATHQTYRRFLDIVRRRSLAPILATPGNHDLAAPFAAVFEHVATRSIDLGPWRIVAVDTHVDDQVGGVVAESAMQELAAAFDGHQGFRVVVGHHPGQATGTPWLDKDTIANADEFLALLTRLDVSAYVFGHLHQSVDATQDAVRLLGAPSTCFQFAPGTERFTVDDAQPGYRSITLYDDGRMEAEVVRVG